MNVYKFDIGDRVRRPIDVFSKNWKYKFGMVVRRYSRGDNPELYDVWWDHRDQPDYGYLPHGLELAGFERKDSK